MKFLKRMFCLGGFCPGGFWQGGFLSGGFLSGGLCPGGFCLGGFCPDVTEFTMVDLRILLIIYLQQPKLVIKGNLICFSHW